MLYKLFYVLFSGFTEFFPVSARPHQMLYAFLTGIPMTDAMVPVVIHLGALLAVASSCRNRVRRLLREDRHARATHRRRNRHVDRVALLDMQVLRTAVVPLIISVFFYKKAERWVDGLLPLCLTLVINGVIVFLPRVLSLGNKDGRTMSRLDSLTMGLGGALAPIPGFSRVGGILSFGMLRGADREYLLDAAFILSIPVLLVVVALDIYAVFVSKMVLSSLALLCYLLMAALSFGAAYLGIMIMRYLTLKAEQHCFSYYSWGLAMFTFILYLMI